MVARKTTEAPVRRWKFSAKPPVGSAKEFRELLWLQGKAYNELLEIEREGRVAYWRAREEYTPGMLETERAFDAAKEEHKAAGQEIEDYRQAVYAKTGKKTREVPPEMRARLDAAKDEVKRLKERLDEHKEAFDRIINPWKQEEQRRLSERKKDLHASNSTDRRKVNAEVLAELERECDEPAYLATLRIKNETNERMNAACRGEIGKYCRRLPRAIRDGLRVRVAQAMKTTKHGLPAFRSNVGGADGEVAVAFKRKRGVGTTYADLWEKNGTAWLRDDDGAWLPEKECRKAAVPLRLCSDGVWRGARYAILSIRIGVEGKRKSPVFAEIPVKLHHEPPLDAEVMSVAVVARRIGREWLYQLQLVLEHSSFAEPKRPVGVGTVRVTYGWEQRPDGVRVATATGQDGWSDELVLSDHVDFNNGKTRPGPLAMVAHGDVLVGIRKHIDNSMVEEALPRILARLGSRLTHVERSIRSEANHIMFERQVEDYANFVLGDRLLALWIQWRDERKGQDEPMDLHEAPELVIEWAEQRGLGEADAMAFWMYLWLRKTRHLREYAAFVQRRGRNMRKECVREWAIRLATRYEFLEVNRQRFAAAARRRGVDDDETTAQLHADRVRRNRWLTAPGEARAIVCEVFGGTPDTKKSYPRIVDTARNDESSSSSAESSSEVVAAE